VIAWLRSLVFLVLAAVWSLSVFISCMPSWAMSRRIGQQIAGTWSGGLLYLLRLTCGITWRIEGKEHVPPGAAVIACKHQSAWDVLIFHSILDDAVFVAKRELFDLPWMGRYLRNAGNIAIDRALGFRAIKSMLPEVDTRLSEGAQVVVFPEGTRVAPGQSSPYHPGIAAIYARTQTPVIPTALNSGQVWRRRSFVKRPGLITLRFLPAMPTGLERREFLRTLQHRIDEQSNDLLDDALYDADRKRSVKPHETEQEH
jgi:1-acyl-sn-glycerol-3-phosphate acyltransferase